MVLGTKSFVLGLVIVVGFAPIRVQAQWAGEFTKVDRYERWRNAAGPYGPDKAIGASCLAFAPNGSLYLACEKFPDLVIIPPNGTPQQIRLQGVITGTDGEADVDLEAMSIHDGSIFLMDEDNLVVYQTSLEKAGAVTTLPVVVHNGQITKASVDNNPTNLASVEGLVVSDKYLGPQSHRALLLGKGPYFYLLDERDEDEGRMKSKLFIGTRVGNSIEINHEPVVFELDDPSTAGASPANRFRLCELFEYQGSLHALKTLKGRYHVVRCDLEAGTLAEICDFSDASNNLRATGFDNNFEGAAVHQDGRLFLTADNEEFPNGGNGTPPEKKEGRGKTPLVSLRVRQ